VTAIQTHEAAQTASVNGYDLLVLAGFSVDPEAQAFIQKTPIKNLIVHFASVNPDVLVGHLLKTSRANQLFTVFGSPDVKIEPLGASGARPVEAERRSALRTPATPAARAESIFHSTANGTGKFTPASRFGPFSVRKAEKFSWSPCTCIMLNRKELGYDDQLRQ
jgi:hypothetical protein